MSDVLSAGEVVHVVCRRRFADDVRRHMVGEVMFVDNGVARIDAFLFVYDRSTGHFIRRPRMDRVVALTDSANVVTILPPRIDVESLDYAEGGPKLTLTDGGDFEMDISEFAASGT
ncbi:MAG: hypothetical protein GC159_15170 [Phycisphaera sp.]|nr:hypothetical protein [Phycisphaera sp.]